jgi:membrane-bound lytic murein transglycosylase B
MPESVVFLNPAPARSRLFSAIYESVNVECEFSKPLVQASRMESKMRLTALIAIVAALGSTPAAADFSGCVERLKASAIGSGVGSGLAAEALDGARRDEKVLRLAGSQPEFKTPIWDYLGFLVDDPRIIDGQRMMWKYDRVLRAAE